LVPEDSLRGWWWQEVEVKARLAAGKPAEITGGVISRHGRSSEMQGTVQTAFRQGTSGTVVVEHP